ncbi:glycoside hydrolase family 39 protein [Aaosphaeria arxii CBS 175.79]|uniref:Glycoside hydrolase family 39 protein n=1 Tax=Aaosphaeria arxii CBS 175.79 TaxID=1450172 RepID=A0A6A5X9X8_9PLEO|nr:glycoside hydrolase family 39 protein [Aaosphaeria arxii CBS 175.79]KAF2009778.1 glycoside hydrolase family 39 protein [Aaosphaeria arxii CBS 175.79]
MLIMVHSQFLFIALVALWAPVVSATSRVVRQDVAGTATVNIGYHQGEAKFLGAGFIYGFPDNGSSADDSIPDYFVRDIKFQTSRGGGSQISYEGWATGGLEQYRGRFASALSNYRTSRKFGGSYLLMPSDLWGAQGGAPENFPFPGDNGDWSEMEKFLRQVISDIKDNDMLDGLVIDLWNEPDLDSFWNRPWSQYVEYFVRASLLFKSEFPEARLSGPSSAHSPHKDSENWRAWLSSISQNNAVPDIYSWHQIGAWEREPDTTIPALKALLAEYNLPERPVDVNEYAWPDEQNPANSVYYLSQLERHNIRGLRANWGGGPSLHDFMANLIWKDDGGYYPNGEWHLYKYYARMEGERVATSASSDLKFDAFAVLSGRRLKIIAGTRTVKARYNIEITGFTDSGVPPEGSLTVGRYQFDWAGAQGRIWDALYLGTATYEYSQNKLIIPFDPPTEHTAFAFEVELP